jgi:hypothetical protein
MVVAFIFLTAACNQDEVFEREQYKPVFALMSGNSTDNVYRVEHDLREPESIGYISVSLGGTNLLNRDVNITLAEDPDVLLAYNRNLYQEVRERYHPALQADRYSFDSGYTMTIRAGETKASLPVTIRPVGLVPDSARFLSLRVDSYSAGELNLEKKDLLYEVRVKNWWCTFSGTNYVSRSVSYEDKPADDPDQVTPVNLYVNKGLYPIGPAAVRLRAGIENTDTYALAVEIDDSQFDAMINGRNMKCSPVRIAAYKGRLDVTQVDGTDPYYDPDYPNVALVDDNGLDPKNVAYRTYKTLLLQYRFTGSDGKLVRITEELRLDFVEDPKDPRFLTN